MPTTVPGPVTQSRTLLRYDKVAAALHWITAAALFAQIVIGFVFHAMERGPVRSDWFAWHKTVGVAILLLSLARLAWRLANPPPPFPTELPRWERRVAVWNHRAFYFVLIALPLTGLLAVSGYTDLTAIDLVGGVRLPPIPGVSEGVGATAEEVHKNLVQLTIALLALHLGAAIKHRFLGGRQSRVSGKMPPLRGPQES